MDPSLLHTTQSASNHLLRNSAADQVLSINELLSLVFSFMSQGCNATNARVCKKWCDIALDRLWRKVTDITCLFNILGTLSDYNGYKVSRSCLRVTAHPNHSIHCFFRSLTGSQSRKTGPGLRTMDDAFGNSSAKTILPTRIQLSRACLK